LSFKIALTDGNGNPKQDHEIYVTLKGITGTHGKTNSNGVLEIDLRGPQTIQNVTCYGRVLHNHDLVMKNGDTLNLTYR
jgi:hypothetical protein